MEIKRGQVWIDKDPRMDEQLVLVDKVDEANGWVFYASYVPLVGVTGRKRRSMLKRFPKAFRLA